MPNALVIQHEDYEALAGFEKPIINRGYAITSVNVRDPDFAIVDFLDPDLLVIMGGPMGVYETDRHPWLNHEIIRVAERIMARLPTLGVCLGSQIMAAAMGANVYRGAHNEVGFKPLALTYAGMRSALNVLREVPVLHWHGDTFELPDGATLLASSDLYANQAFSCGPNILALQFHPEMGEDESFAAWCEHGDPFIAKAGTNVDELMSDHARHGPTAVAAGRNMLDQWLAQLSR
ncbi:MAG: glutamine amidotransferase [Sphingomonadaceae bacterium]